MKRKMSALLLALAMLLTCVACAAAPEPTEQPTQTPAAETEPEILETVAETYPKTTPVNTRGMTDSEIFDAYAQAYYADLYENGNSQLDELYLMSTMTFLTVEESDIAPYWRFRNGMLDGDLGSIAAFTMKQVLDAKGGFETDYELIWNTQHGAADYSFDEIVAYIDSTAASGKADTEKNSEYSAYPALDFGQYADHWVYMEQVQLSEKGKLQDTFFDTPCYVLFGVEYYTESVSEICRIDIAVPAEYVEQFTPVGTYTDSNGTSFPQGSLVFKTEELDLNGNGSFYSVDTAPILFQNNVDAYRESGSISLGSSRKGGPGINADMLAAGCIYVNIGCRGKDTSDADGTAPAAIVDMKAAVRYLKYYDALIPGDSNKIYSSGGSAGGAMSSLLGASGNSKLFDPYLEANGAIMESRDDIYGALVFCPLADLGWGDAAYEWLHQSETAKASPSGHLSQMESWRIALHDVLVTSYEAHLVEDLDLNIEKYREEWTALFEDSLNRYINEVESTTSGLSTVANEFFGDAGGFVAADESGQMYIKADGSIGVKDVFALIATYMPRAKAAPGFDVGDCKSNEGGEFDELHFSESVYEAFKLLSENQ